MWRDIFVTVIQFIVASPRAWKEIDQEDRTLEGFTSRFLYPIFGIIALASFVGGLWFTRDGDLQGALKDTIVSVVAVFGGFYIASYALNEAAPRFGQKKDLHRFQQFVGYSSVVLYALYTITSFLPDFFILWLLVLYTLYLVYTGAAIYLKVLPEKRVNFSILASVLVVLTPTLIRVLFSFLIQ